MSTVTSSGFVYSTELSEGHLRLLQIQLQGFDQDGEPILAGQLISYDVHQRPPYIALSYAWHEPLALKDGEQPVPKTVTLNAQDISVTPNLFYALHHLATHQPTTQASHYWIDALSINQHNDDERTSQVAIMHRIYQSAEKVVVWLGPDHAEEAYTVLEFFRALLQQFFDEDDMFNDSKGPRHYAVDFLDRDVENTLAASHLPPLDSHTGIWESVVRFWDQQWFSRAW